MNKKLSFYEFLQLSKEQQYTLTIDKAIPVSSVVKNTTQFVLYQLYDFYVEIAYDAERKSFVSITGFIKPDTTNHIPKGQF